MHRCARRTRAADRGLARGEPAGALLYPLYLRGGRARAVRQRQGAGGLHRSFDAHRYADLVRAVIEGLGWRCAIAIRRWAICRRNCGSPAARRGRRRCAASCRPPSGVGAGLHPRGSRRGRRGDDGCGRRRRLSLDGSLHRRMGDPLLGPRRRPTRTSSAPTSVFSRFTRPPGAPSSRVGRARRPARPLIDTGVPERGAGWFRRSRR